MDIDGRIRKRHTWRYMSPIYLEYADSCETQEPYLVSANHPDGDAKSVAHLYIGEADTWYDVFTLRRLLKEDLARISKGVGALILGLTLLIYRRLELGPALP